MSDGAKAGLVRTEVDKILSSRHFLGQGRLSQFLRFAVNESIEGRGGQIKEYVVGMEVYQRDAAYDPRTDSIVRVEASKLRAKLAQYYEGEGRADPVVISIPKGGYAARFEYREGRSKRPAYRRPSARTSILAGLGLALAASVLWLAPRPAVESLPPPRMLPLTSFPGREFRPSLSPDGKQAAFSWNGEREDNYDIYVKLIEGGAPLRLTSSPEWEGAPAWSPRGPEIAFLRGSDVYLISPLGGPARKLTAAQGAYLAWTPDGRSLAIMDRAVPGAPAHLSLVSIATGEMQRLTSPPSHGPGDCCPAFSPDGRTLAFVRGGSLCVQPVGRGQLRCLLTELAEIGGVAWTPSGKELVFSSTRGGDFQLWRIPAGAASEVKPQLVAGAGENASHPSISGTRLAYQRVLYDVNVWRMEVAAPRGKAGAVSRIIASTRSDSAAQYSPDGQRIAFVSDRTGNSEIWVCDRDATSFLQVTSFRGASVRSPQWSPDGSRIAFDSNAGGSDDLYVVGLDGVSLRRLTNEDRSESRPSWSHDGRWIYFCSDRSGRPQIWKVPAKGGPAVPVTRNGGLEAFEAPGADRLFYVKPGARPSLWSIPAGGGNEEQVLEVVRPGYWAAAKPGIYFVDFAQANAIKRLAADSGQTSLIGRIPRDICDERPGFSASGDGRSVLFSQIDRFEADLVVLDNFR